MFAAPGATGSSLFDVLQNFLHPLPLNSVSLPEAFLGPGGYGRSKLHSGAGRPKGLDGPPAGGDSAAPNILKGEDKRDIHRSISLSSGSRYVCYRGTRVSGGRLRPSKLGARQFRYSLHAYKSAHREFRDPGPYASTALPPVKCARMPRSTTQNRALAPLQGAFANNAVDLRVIQGLFGKSFDHGSQTRGGI